MSRSPFFRLGLRLTLLNTVVFGLVLVGFAAIAYALMGHALLGGVDRANRDAVDGLMRGLTLTAEGPRTKPDFGDEAREAVQLHGVATERVLDAQGRPVDGAGPLPPHWGAEGPERETVAWQGDRIRLLRVPLAVNGKVVGFLLVGHALTATDEASSAFLWSLGEAIPIALLLTLAAGASLGTFAVRPVREAFERQRQFLADASHELRTPIAVVQAQAGIVLDRPAPAPEFLAEALKTIYRTSERMGRLVNDMLFLTRFDANGLALQCRRFFLDELVEEVVEDFRELAKARGLDLQLVAPLPEVAVVADPDRIHQLLVVLLDNALKFTPDGGQVQVALGAEPAGSLARVLVTDTGPGIAPEEQARIFERFYQVDRARAATNPGAGLGLAIARAIAGAHAGTLTVSSRPGEGATFELGLPTGL